MTIRSVRSKLETVVLVCAKCSKKIDGGFGDKGKTPLAKALKKEFGKGSVRAITVKCMGVCPKGAVTVFDPRRPREWLLVAQNTPMSEVADALL